MTLDLLLRFVGFIVTVNVIVVVWFVIGYLRDVFKAEPPFRGDGRPIITYEVKRTR